MTEDPTIRAPRCPRCGWGPVMALGREQAFCGNPDCRVFTWDMTGDPAQFEATAAVIDVGDIFD